MLVYVPNGPVLPFTTGVSCQQCGAAVSGTPLVSTTTAVDGTFTLTNVPAGNNIPLVVQLGRWRRQIVIPHVTACTTAALTDSQIRLPRTHLEGDIPLTAMATGSVDTLECVLRKIGIADSEFSVPYTQGGSGRVQFYIANGSNITGGAPSDSTLVGNATTLAAYDQVLFACEGSQINQNANDQTRVINYANAGGRVFATHYSYVWLYNDAPFSGTAGWDVSQSDPPDPVLATINTSFAKGATMATWLWNVGASPSMGNIYLNQTRHDFDSVVAPSQNYVSATVTTGFGWFSSSTTYNLHYTFNTPVAATPANQCGRVVFSDFHVANTTSSTGVVFPNECDNVPMTAQEKILEYMLFDLASCIQPTGAPMGCASNQITCGNLCCTSPQVCMGSGATAECLNPYATSGSFPDTVDASMACTAGEQPTWNNLVFVANTPAGTSINVTFYTASTLAGLASATPVPLGTIPTISSPVNLQVALTAAGVPFTLPFAKVVFTLNANSALTAAPTLDGFQLNFDCAQST